MKRLFTILTAAAIAAVSLGTPARAAGHTHSWGSIPVAVVQPLGRSIVLSGTMLPAVHLAHVVDRLNAGRRVPVVISLRSRDQAGLDALVHAQYTPGSPQFHRWITPDAFAGRFAPAANQRRQIESWLRNQGLGVIGASRNGLEIDASGTAAQVERAFRTPLQVYRLHGKRFFANSRPVQVPEGLRPLIGDVTGLSDLAQIGQTDGQGRRLGDGFQHFDQQFNAPTPDQIARFYNLQPLYDAGIQGQNQTIAVFQFSDFVDAHIATFDQEFNLPAPAIQRIGVDGAPQVDQSAENECEMDLEILHAFAPAAQILMYEGNTGSEADWVRIWNKITSDDKANVVSMSYGLPEDQWSKAAVNAMNLAFEQAAAQGQGIFSSTGDYGAYDAHRKALQGKDPNYDKLMAHFPSTSPWVTAVGGTMLEANGDNIDEIAWSETYSNPVKNSGGGGGLSILNKQPWYQSGPGVTNQYSDGYRQTPDVSALAGAPGFTIYTVDDNGKAGWQDGLGGTSAATPLWAAYATLLNQALGQPIGFLNPSLYLLGQKVGTFQNDPFFDITNGDNLYYQAVPGWDYASGWGSMDGAALATDLHALGPVVVHPVAFHFTIWVVGAKKNGKWPILHTITRGKTAKKVYVLDHTTYDAVPLEDVTGTREYTITNGNYTLTHAIVPITIQHSALGGTFEHTLAFKVLPNSPKGTYTVTMKFTAGPLAWTSTATLQFTVK
jgi:subtilase family serine protease